VKPRIRFPTVMCCFVLTLNVAAATCAADRSLLTSADIVAYAKPAVVFIRHRDETGQQSTGTGFLVHKDGLVITCAHVVQSQPRPGSKISDKIWVRLYDGCVHEAQRPYCDSASDIALLKIDVREYPYLDVGLSPPKVGDEVLVIGYPLGRVLAEEPSVTRGIISAVRFSNTAYQLDAAVNPGNSGGPVLNKDGDVLGVLSFKVRGAEGLAFAIAASVLLNPPTDGSFPLAAFLLAQHLLVVRDGMKQLERQEGESEESHNLMLRACRELHVIDNTRSPLHRAADVGDVAQVKKLIAQGCSVNLRDAYMSTPLHEAARLDQNVELEDKGYRSRKLEIAKLLVDKGADVNARDESQATPLHDAAIDFTECARLLVDHGANTNAQGGLFLCTPLHRAAIVASAECVQLLLEHGADVNIRDHIGRTALAIAIEGAKSATGDRLKAREKIIRILREHGATE